MALIGGVIGVKTKEGLFLLLLFMLAGFISILVHELGHACTARWFGKKVHIVLEAFGGYAAYSGGGPLSRKQTFLITAAGPAIQIVLGLGVWALLQVPYEFAPYARHFLGVLVLISIIWAVLNLLPVLPMDGGRILETILGPQRFRLTLQVSIAVAVVVALLALVFKIGLLLPIFMGIMAFENYKALKQMTWG